MTELCPACLSELLNDECSGCACPPNACKCAPSVTKALRMIWFRIGRPARVAIPASLVIFAVSFLLLTLKTLPTTLLALMLSIFATVLGFTFMIVAAVRVLKRLK